MTAPDTSASQRLAAFEALHRGLPRQGPGSDATTRELLRLAGPLPERPRVLDLGCGPGRSALLLAAEAGARVTAVDLHQPFLDELQAAAAATGLTSIRTLRCSMLELPFAPGTFDLIWVEGAVYNVGFDPGLAYWRLLLAPGGVLVVTECEWSTGTPSAAARAFWDGHYELRRTEQNLAAARVLGYTVEATYRLPDSDWFDEYYTPLEQRVASGDPAYAAAAGSTLQEIEMRRRHGDDYQYTGHVLRLGPPSTGESGNAGSPTWSTRPERAARDRMHIRDVLLAAFPTPLEADLVDALRADPQAWIPELSWVSLTDDGTVAGYSLLTRCHVGGAPALALGPCAVRPECQSRGAGSAAIRAGLEQARKLGENLVVVLGHAEYYPRFGFVRASQFGISATFDVPDENLMALALDPSAPVPSGVIRYAPPFGV
jgi:predicted N-acetyltransferase YhbS/ubiquinone/menaquinone biosynthesis C-methylase UbiE